MVEGHVNASGGKFEDFKESIDYLSVKMYVQEKLDSLNRGESKMECEFPTINSKSEEIKDIFLNTKTIAIVGLFT